MALVALTSCYSLRSSSGGAQATFDGQREYSADDIAVPTGYRVELVTRDLTFPTGLAFDSSGGMYVVESGYCYGETWTVPRLLRIESDGRVTTVATGGKNGPWNGVDFADGAFFVAEGGVLEGGRILRITAQGEISVVLEGLPSYGDHHTNGPVVRDGWVYFGQGTATNSGVVGADNAQFGWLTRSPEFCDVPGADVVLSGLAFETDDVLDGGRARTGAFAPFGSMSDHRISGSILCNGAVLRVAVGGGSPELVAWGFRNPFGLAFSPDGGLYATDNGYDDRGSRPVWGAADHLWRVETGLWYGWPDYSGNRLLTDDAFRPPGRAKIELLLASHHGTPPAPVASLGVHCSANGLHFSHAEAFGHVGEAFVALFGDQAPAVGKLLAPVGFKVVRVNVTNGGIEDFAANKGKSNGPASSIGNAGLERPIAVRFDPEGEALYIVDFGVLLQHGVQSLPQPRTGAVWRISKVGAP